MKTVLKLFILTLFPFIIGISMPEPDIATMNWLDEEFNPEHLDGPFTGGFGEQTCHSCHFDYDLNQKGGSLSVAGIPETLIPDEKAEITVTVESEHLKNAGFQISARFKDGSQAGSFAWKGDRLMFTPNISDNVKYLQHSREGTTPTGDREAEWTFTWTAPEAASQPIIFNVAANAGNDDDSAFGDWIYVDEQIIRTD